MLPTRQTKLPFLSGLHLSALLSVCVVNSNAVDIIAHRGASEDAPENTLSSFKLGYQQNADADELDIHLTKDGRIVVLHDDNTGRTGGVKKKIADQTLDEIRALEIGKWGRWKDAGFSEKVPLLSEVLALIPDGKRLFIEIKCGPEVLPELERVIKASAKNPRHLAIIAFSLQVAAEAKSKLPDTEVCWLYDWKKDKDSGARFSPDELIGKAKSAGLDGLDLKFDGPIDAAFVAKARTAGLKCYVWTVDDARVARRLAAAGVDGITTNRPSWLREHLAK